MAALSPDTRTDVAANKIVLIDDDASWAAALSNYLREEGFEVETAADGEEGLGRLRQVQPDLIILDMSMPRMGGLEMLRALHNAPQRAPVLVISADSQASTIMDAMAAGADGFLQKPVSPAHLTRTIRRLTALGSFEWDKSGGGGQGMR